MGTRRQEIVALLSARPATVRELAVAFGVPMSQIVDDLTRLQRSLGHRLEVSQAQCHECGFRIARQRRFTAPSRCPRCRSERTWRAEQVDLISSLGADDQRSLDPGPRIASTAPPWVRSVNAAVAPH